MQRRLAPTRQVEEVARFVRASGGIPKHSAVLELVARLNGAANWNELERKGPADTPEKAVSKPGAHLPRGGQQSQKAPRAEKAYVVDAQSHIRDVDNLTTQVLFIGTNMFDESEPWFLMADNEMRSHMSRELSDEELLILGQQGVVVSAVVEHPRVDRYGIPDVAVTSGLLEWLHDEQGMFTCRPEQFELYSEDTGDDSPAFCILEVRLPKQLAFQ